MEKKRKWKELRTSNSQGSKSGNLKMATFSRHRCLHGKCPLPHHDHQGSHHSHLDGTTKTIEPGAIFARESHKCFAFESFVFKTMLEGFDSPDFRVKKYYSFSEIYMENVIGDSLLSGKINDGNVNVRVNFTVVPSQSMGDELVVEDGRVYFDFDKVNGYGGNLDDHDAVEGVGYGGVNVVEA
ncbi:hypothetical protein Goklo_021370 [Gossypium klotzschianum]|uniref:GIL1/IRKI C-terminal domain-containing protein n=1 Tax=Gossypium klotzschianum TaxID=34286 RepID=A0A7J8UV90_9ROSI|nr:hypothetical protein [Gossypium klotzschianum]